MRVCVCTCLYIYYILQLCLYLIVSKIYHPLVHLVHFFFLLVHRIFPRTIVCPHPPIMSKSCYNFIKILFKPILCHLTPFLFISLL